jgi:hypothetical protein
MIDLLPEFKGCQNNFSSALGMTRPRLATVESALASGLVLFLPVKGQKVKGVSPRPLEKLIRSREGKPTGPTYETTITASLGHDFDT